MINPDQIDPFILSVQMKWIYCCKFNVVAPIVYVFAPRFVLLF